MSLDRIRLQEGLRKLGIVFDDSTLDALDCLDQELKLWKVRGFVGDSEEDILTRHILDCAAGVPYMAASACSRIADLGSGAGFPGIVLAALLQKRQFVLIESSSNRAAFLNNVRALSKLDNVTVVNSRVEEIKDAFDLVTWRAFKSLSDIEVAAVRLVKEDGHIAAYKGRLQAIDQEMSLSRYPWKRIDTVPLDVPGLHAERNLLILVP